MLIEDLFRAPWHERMKGVVQKMVDNVENIKSESIAARLAGVGAIREAKAHDYRRAILQKQNGHC